jgi:outer membrane protein TolC
MACAASVVIALLGSGVAARAQVAPKAATAVPDTLTLDDAIAIALRQQPQLFTAYTQVTQANGQKQQAQAQYYPTVTPTYTFQDSSHSSYGVATSGLGGGASAVQITRGGGLAVALNQTLLDGGQREATNAQARRQVDVARFNKSDVRQQIIFNVTQAYYNLLAAEDQVTVAQAQVNRFQQTVDLTQAQIDAGTTAAKDIYQSKADLASAQITLLQNENAVQTASTNLKNVIGVEISGNLNPARLSEGGTLPPVPTGGEALGLEDYVKQAYTNRPDLREQEAAVQSQEAAVRAARIKAGFSVNTTYALNYQATNDVGYRGLDSQLILSGTYPLFDAGSARGAVHVAEAQRDAGRNQLEQTRQSVRRDVEIAVANRASSLQQTALAQAAVKAAQVNYDAAVDARKEGVGTVIDITTAQATLTQAQNQYVNAVYNFYIDDAALLKAVGRNYVAGSTPVR